MNFQNIPKKWNVRYEKLILIIKVENIKTVFKSEKIGCIRRKFCLYDKYLILLKSVKVYCNSFKFFYEIEIDIFKPSY